nr:flagellar export chaperone FlgN [Duganella sp. 1224]
MRALLAGVTADLQAYPQLEAQLHAQFRAALRHKSVELAAAAEAIGTLVDAMLARRAERVALVQRLVGDNGTMAQAFALLKSPLRETMEGNWTALEQAVIECKRLSKRNGDLLAEQYTIMQRVLHGEEQIYAPA